MGHQTDITRLNKNTKWDSEQMKLDDNTKWDTEICQ